MVIILLAYLHNASGFTIELLHKLRVLLLRTCRIRFHLCDQLLVCARLVRLLLQLLFKLFAVGLLEKVNGEQ